MTISAPEFEAFKAYVDEVSGFRERECQRYLKYAAKFLVPGTSTGIVSVPEDPNFFGKTDFVIGAELRNGLGRCARHAYIWELKAPQCYLFEQDTKHRCRPTAEFLQAENQLLHYFHEASGNGRFRERMGVIDQDNIHMGGIVIGTNERILRGSDGFEQAYTALTVREKYFYRASAIRVLTWDEILEFLNPIDTLLE
jgi:Domain of unknown function (DUF4263)